MSEAITDKIGREVSAALENFGYSVEEWRLDITAEIKNVPAGLEPTGRKTWVITLRTAPMK